MARRILNGLDLVNQRAINLADPSSAQDAATKNYVDAATRNVDWKASVRAGSTGNVSITSAPASIDGVTFAAGDRVLLKDQTTGSENGIYTFSAASSALTRANDADTSAKVTSGMAVTITEGTVNDNRVYLLITNDPITIGTTALVFTQLGAGSAAYTAGNGLSLSGQAFAVVAGSGIIADGTSTRVDTSVVARKYAANVGDGSATAITITHNLGTRDVTVSVHDASTFDEVECDVNKATVNTVTLTFATAPAASAYRATIHG